MHRNQCKRRSGNHQSQIDLTKVFTVLRIKEITTYSRVGRFKNTSMLHTQSQSFFLISENSLFKGNDNDLNFKFDTG